jgi:integral membrane sensor domain MASE1
MNKKFCLALTLSWILAFALFYASRGILALLAFEGMPDEAFGFIPGIERLLVLVLVVFSAVVFGATGAIYFVANRISRRP